MWFTVFILIPPPQPDLKFKFTFNCPWQVDCAFPSTETFIYFTCLYQLKNLCKGDGVGIMQRMEDGKDSHPIQKID